MKLGFEKLKIISINPDEEELLIKFRDFEEEDFNYNYIDNNNNILIDFYLEDSSYSIYKHRIILEKEEHTTFKGHLFYINQTADYQMVKSEDQLFENFKFFKKGINWNDITKRYDGYEDLGPKEYRIAYKGEIELLSFLSSYCDKNKYDIRTNYFLNMDKLFKGNFTELKSYFISTGPFDIVGLFMIKNNEEILNKRFLPYKIWADIRNNMQISKYNNYIYKQFISNIEISDINNFYLLEKSKTFSESMLPVKKILKHDEPVY